MAQISLAWMLTKPGVSAPIIGTTSLANLEDILGESPGFGRWLSLVDGLLTGAGLTGCLDVTLTEEEVKYLEEPYQPCKISGHM